MKWQDMLKLDDEALLAKGVAALGARRKLLKVFDQIKAHCEANVSPLYRSCPLFYLSFHIELQPFY
jgi:hypothetical protein